MRSYQAADVRYFLECLVPKFVFLSRDRAPLAVVQLPLNKSLQVVQRGRKAVVLYRALIKISVIV